MNDLKKNNNSIALLIDADNISSKYIKTIVNELSENYGTISVKRAYGDWTTDTLKPWKKVMLEYSLTPIQQFSYTSGKNSTDSAMIIDAMDILYTKEIDIFCLATSDCDFTKIASRLRESGKTVVGMGESKTNKSFVSACNEFKFIDVLTDTADENTAVQATASAVENKKSSITPLEDVKNAIYDFINSADGKLKLGGLKTQIKTKFTDFDERNYGYSKFSTFVSSFNEISIDTTNNSNEVSITISSNNDDKKIRQYIVNQISDKKKKYFTSAEIQNMILKEYKDFKLKNLGYSNMKAFLKSIDDLTISDNGKYRIK